MMAGSNDHALGIDNKAGFHKKWVPTMRLDDLMPLLGVPELPVALKIDVDGFEDLVLQGGIATLMAPNVRAITIELNRQHADKLLADLQGLGWKVTRRIDETTAPGNTGFGSGRFDNMIYVQLEK